MLRGRSVITAGSRDEITALYTRAFTAAAVPDRAYLRGNSPVSFAPPRTDNNKTLPVRRASSRIPRCSCRSLLYIIILYNNNHWRFIYKKYIFDGVARLDPALLCVQDFRAVCLFFFFSFSRRRRTERARETHAHAPASPPPPHGWIYCYRTYTFIYLTLLSSRPS